MGPFEYAMYKLSLAITWPITQLAPPFEQILITHTQGLFVQYLIDTFIISGIMTVSDEHIFIY